MGVRLFRCVRARESQKRNISENIKLEDAQRSNEEFETRRGSFSKRGQFLSHIFIGRKRHPTYLCIGLPTFN